MRTPQSGCTALPAAGGRRIKRLLIPSVHQLFEKQLSFLEKMVKIMLFYETIGDFDALVKIDTDRKGGILS